MGPGRPAASLDGTGMGGTPGLRIEKKEMDDSMHSCNERVRSSE